ncbi:orotate phosphoribosyltransferase [Brevibacterium sp. 50QC2O2]|uniref:orotate phosphoribosyltransferase n=1 Tax=Brevibacterium TaxID=1696 RepID=UPI00211C47F9|nr:MULTISPECIES: orotate phosphoribosyltransferase [unclassified Brevibacterium]MCQ9385249.1 orotate phosphoribosyltransferase [Brevibacterium sp. 68QC2CO]MCQ9388755.1 orotate phosphoribosyltransferase [Brevibacterium sp. 50QC2O2]
MAQNHAADTRSQLLALIDELAVVRGKVTLSSGREADYYLDLRRVTLDHRSAPLVGDIVLDVLAENDLLDRVDAVGGLTMGADPVGTAVMHRSVVRGTPLDAFVVRKEAKKHGMGRRVEGPDVAGRKVIAVEDTSTTGGSVLTAVEALQEAGAQVVAVVVVMDRNTGAKERVEAQGIPYLSALTTADLGLD